MRGDCPEVGAGEPSTSVSVQTRSRVPSVVSTAAPAARGSPGCRLRRPHSPRSREEDLKADFIMPSFINAMIVQPVL